MKKEILPALIAASFAVGAGAADRELLFGPDTGQATVRVQAKDSSSAPKRSAQEHQSKAKVTAPVALKKEAVKVAAPVVVAKKKEDAPKIEAKVEKPAEIKVAAKPEAKPEVKVAAKPEVKVEAKVEVKEAVKPETKPVVAKAPEKDKTAAKTSVAAAVAAAAVAAPVVAAASSPAPTPVVAEKKPETVVAAAPAAPIAVLAPVKPIAISGQDPIHDRRILASSLNQSVEIGFFPQAASVGDAFKFQADYLPLANFMSSQSGILANFVPERDLNAYRRRILSNEYPMIFVNAALSKEAAEAGYVQVAVGFENLMAGFLVRDDSPFKELKDLKKASVSWSSNAQISYLAMATLAEMELVKDNSFTDVGAAGRQATLAALNTKTADVAVVRSTEANAEVKKSEGKLRLLGTSIAAPASGVWVRKDIVNRPETQRLIQSLFLVKPDATGQAKYASDGFARGFGVAGHFKAADPEVAKNLETSLFTAEQSFSAYFPKFDIDTAKVKQNIARPAYQARTNQNSSDSLSERANLVNRLSQGINIGVSTDAPNVLAFQGETLAIANHLSDKTGALVSMIPEKISASFATGIRNGSYPVVMINPLLVAQANYSGYVPVASSNENYQVAYVVPLGSAANTISDFKDKVVSGINGSEIDLIGLVELSTEGVGIKKFDHASSDLAPDFILKQRLSDAVILDVSDAKKIVNESKDADGKPLYRMILSDKKYPKASLWAFSDYANEPVVKNLVSVMSSSEKRSELRGRTWVTATKADMANSTVIGDEIDRQNLGYSVFKPTKVDNQKENVKKAYLYTLAKKSNVALSK